MSFVSESQQHPPPPCECQQQFGGALPWLAITLAILVVLDRWNGRRQKQKQETERLGTGNGGLADGGNR
jgi:hypothetical protein